MRKFFASSILASVGVVVVTGCGGIVGPYPDSDFGGEEDSGTATGTIGLPIGASADAGTGGTTVSPDGGVVFVDSGVTFGDDDDDGGTIGDDDTDASFSTDGGTDGGVIPDAGEGSGAPILGAITFTAPTKGNKGSTPGFARASFFTETVAPPSACSQTAPTPACMLTVCASGQETPLPVDTNSTEQAGPITVVESGMSYILASKGGFYDDATYGNAPYDALISIAAPGFDGEIPAFSFAFPEPGDTAITAPVETLVPMAHPSVNPPEYSTSFPRSADLPVSWTGGVAGTNIAISLFALTSMATYTLECTFDQGSGTGVVPSFAGLSQFPLVDGTTITGSVTYDWSVSRTTTAGHATITASLTGRRPVHVIFTTTN